MIHSDASSIQRRAVGKRASEIRDENAGHYCVVVRFRKGIYIGCNGRRGDAPRKRRGYRDPERLRSVESSALVRSEEECMVLPDRTAQNPTEVVVVLRGSRVTPLVGKPVVRIHDGVP